MPMIQATGVRFGSEKWPRERVLGWFEFQPWAEGCENFPAAVWKHLEGDAGDPERELGTCIEMDTTKGAPKLDGERFPASATVGDRGALFVVTRIFLTRAREQS
jgi:hypothetical protein